MAPILRINQHDANLGVWRQIREAYESRLEKLRAKLENPSWPAEQRTDLIARIDEIKALLSIDKSDESNVAGAGE